MTLETQFDELSTGSPINIIAPLVSKYSKTLVLKFYQREREKMGEIPYLMEDGDDGLGSTKRPFFQARLTKANPSVSTQEQDVPSI